MGVWERLADELEREAEHAAKSRRWLEQPATWIEDRLGEHSGNWQ